MDHGFDANCNELVGVVFYGHRLRSIFNLFYGHHCLALASAPSRSGTFGPWCGFGAYDNDHNHEFYCIVFGSSNVWNLGGIAYYGAFKLGSRG